MKNTHSVLIGVVLLLIPFSFSEAEERTVASPDGKLNCTIQWNDNLSYSVSFDGRKIIGTSRLGLDFKGAEPFVELELKETKKTKANDQWEYLWGRQRFYTDHYNGLILRFQEKSGSQRPLGLEFRAYNDGIAFRYLIDEKTVGGKTYTLNADLTEYCFPGNPDAWFTDFRSARSSQEHEYPKSSLDTIFPESFIGCPLVVQSSQDGPYIALAEAELNHWGGLYFATPSERTRILFESGTMKRDQAAKPFDISLKDIGLIILECDKTEDGAGYDHADWVDLELIDASDNKKKLTELTPLSITQGYGKTRIDRSCDDNPLRISGQEYKNGFGTHADGKIIIRLDKPYVSLRGAVGVDDEVKKIGTVNFRVHGSLKDSKGQVLQAKLAPRHDGNGVAVASCSDKSPWRLIIVAPKAINLLDQTILMNVSAPTDSSIDWSWLKPGSASWDWWSGGFQMNTENLKKYVDFAAEMGFPYHLIDAPWYGDINKSHSSIMKGKKDVDIEELARYAKSKDVGLVLWLYWTDADRDYLKAFPYYEKLGIAGVKIDFMDRDDQEMVEWYDKIVRKAAEHKLFVDYHGAYKPTGYRRTFPNLITREGIRGNEYHKWATLSPEHYCTLPYTRLMLGPGDFTPGSFNTHFSDQPKHSDIKTAQGIGTRAHELAICMLYDSPFLCFCDAHHVYRANMDSGVEYLKRLPTVWDESRGVDGEIGQYVSMVRRKGNDWYYAAITDKNSRTLTLSLDFLDSGEYEAMIYADNDETKKDPRKISISKRTVKKSDKLNVRMIREGGQTIVFQKKDKK